jgi:diguanylate cyclase (GGDEF)-like protein/PAS domain S-box-containing protein
MKSQINTGKNISGDDIFDGVHDLSKIELEALVEELHSYQIELEMQNNALKESANKLERTQSKYYDLFNSAPVGYLICSQKGIIQEVNHIALEVLRAEKIDLINTAFPHFSAPGFQDTYYLHIRDVIEIGGVHEQEMELLLDSGETIQVHLESKAAIDDQDEIIIRSVIIDTSSSRLTAIARGRFDALADEALVGIFYSGKNGIARYVNKALADIAGHPSEEMVGSLWHFKIHPDDREEVTAQWLASVGAVEPWFSEYRFLQPDGTVIWVLGHTSPQLDTKGGVVGHVGTVMDITESKANEENLRKSNALLNQAEQIGKLGHWEWDEIANRYIACSEQYAKLHDMTVAQMIEKVTSDEELVCEDDRERYFQVVHAACESNRGWVIEYRRIDKGGNWVYMLESGEPVLDDYGSIIKTIGAVQDITERKQVELDLLESKRRLDEIIWCAGIGTWVWNVQTGETTRNERGAEIIGYTLEELSPCNMDTWNRFFHPDDLRQSNDLMKMVFSRALDEYEFESRLRHKNGDWVWVRNTGKVVEWCQDGKPLRMSGTHTDITDRKIEEDKIRHLALTDSLTGLANRSQFNQRLAQSIKLAKREGKSLALLMIDLDWFKPVNDTFGHQTGDALLQTVASIFTKFSRETDVVARLGGDEFAILVIHPGEEKYAGVHAQKIIDEIKKTTSIMGHDVQIGISIGIALYPNDAGDLEALLKKADLALYDVKERGRGAFAFYRPEMRAKG